MMSRVCWDDDVLGGKAQGLEGALKLRPPYLSDRPKFSNVFNVRKIRRVGISVISPVGKIRRGAEISCLIKN